MRVAPNGAIPGLLYIGNYAFFFVQNDHEKLRTLYVGNFFEFFEKR